MFRSRLPILAITFLIFSACPSNKRTSGLTPENSNGGKDPLVLIDSTALGLNFRLREGVEGAGGREVTPPAKTSPMSDAEVKTVFARLPALVGEAGDEKTFAMREKSLPPPRTGKTEKIPFPPPVAPVLPDKTEEGPLTVLRRMPEGDLPLAPHLSVTFSQPMIAVSSHDEAERTKPVKIEPEPEGKWRWVGAKTILFEPGAFMDQKAGYGRFHKSTEYTVTIKKGTKSALGNALDEEVSWKFSTPTATVTQFYPQWGPFRRDPIMFVSFDQRIDAKDVLKTIKVTAAGKTYSLKLAQDKEVEKDPVVAQLVKSAEKDRWLAFRAEELFPTDTNVQIAIGPGTPSAEGPRKTDAPQGYSFNTYAPLRVTWQNCRQGDYCPPGSALSVEFNNPLDIAKFKSADMVKVTPELKGQKIEVYGNYLTISGRTKGRSTYQVTFASTVPDSFGQTLGKEQTLTFHTGPADKVLYAPGGEFVVLDPSSDAKFTIYTTNYDKVKLKVFKAGPDSWDEFKKYMSDVYYREAWPPDPPGKRVVNEEVKIANVQDDLIETRVDLSKALPDGFGSVIVVVEPPVRPANRWEWRPIIAWVQYTHIGLTAFADTGEITAWATSLEDGKPLEGVEVSLLPKNGSSKTGEDGTATIALSSRPANVLVAKKGKDIAMLPDYPSWWSDQGMWVQRSQGVQVQWYVADDRQMYKPGEEVKVKGWLRKIDFGKGGDVIGFDNAAKKVNYSVRDSVGNEILKGETTLTAAGGFDFGFKLPKTVNLGYTPITLTTDTGGVASHYIQVQEFRRPEFEVSATATEGPLFVGGKADVTVTATYFAGGALSNAETTWYVSTSPGYFVPPNREQYTYGPQQAWWDYYYYYSSDPTQTEYKYQNFSARTDASGKHILGMDFYGVNPPRPTSVVAQATVMDVNRQAWAAVATLLVHPAAEYVGLKTAKPYVEGDQIIKVDAIVTDLDGKAVKGRKIKMRTARLDWSWEGNRYKTTEVDATDCDKKSEDQDVTCEFKPGEGGLYRTTAVITDEAGRKNVSQILVWVAGGKLPADRNVAQEQVRMIPDKTTYGPGDVAEIAVIPPWYPAEATMTLRRSGIVKTERFKITGPSHTLKVKIEEAWTPSMTVQLDLVGSAPRTDDQGNVRKDLKPRPAFAVGQVYLAVPPVQRKLNLAVKPKDEKIEPGAETVVDVTLTDAEGQPVKGGEVTVVIVDESVLSLTGYRMPDPLSTFYYWRSPDTTDHHLRQWLLLAKPEEVANAGPTTGNDRGRADGVMGGSAGSGAEDAPSKTKDADESRVLKRDAKEPKEEAERGASEQQSQNDPAIKVRTDFNALAVFAPNVATDAKGRAQVKVKLPDNLTRYRVMAVAAAGDKKFGAGEATITARLPLMVRPSAPRFLNFGDTFELPVVLQNQTDKPMEVEVVVRATNATITDGSGRKVKIPANDRVEVRFPAAAKMPGTARFQVGAVSGSWSDANQFELPVWTPATTEAFATYGVIDKGAIAQPVKYPENVVKEFGGLEITTSSTALQALTDALLYLVRYPYECSEQMASRVLAVAALRDVLTAFKAEGLPAPDKLIASVDKDLKFLARLQNWDGGWSFWRRGDESWPFLTVHVAHAFARAKQKGFDIPKEPMERAKPYLQNIEQYYPWWWDLDTRRACSAYALYVRNQLGDRDGKKARALIAEAGGFDKLPIEATAWLYSVLTGDKSSADEVKALRKFIGNRVSEEAGTAHWITSYSDSAYLLLHSDRRVDGILLEAMILDQPKSDMIPKVVEGLLAHRTAGRWENTQESAWVLLALDKYFNTYEKQTPDFVAKVWLGKGYAGDHKFKGRTTERALIEVPMDFLAKTSGAQDLIIQKDGKGRLYYRIGMQYAPSDLRLPPSEHGFTVERAYEAVDDKDDVKKDDKGVWHVKAGARVRVRLTMLLQSRRYHVALTDPLPAGLEVMNPALAVTGAIPQDPEQQKNNPYWWWYSTWYEHQNMRDERVEAFGSLVWEGVHTYTYVARATTPGNFVVPPTKAEEMYHPETFGRGAGDRVVVE